MRFPSPGLGSFSLPSCGGAARVATVLVGSISALAFVAPARASVSRPEATAKAAKALSIKVDGPAVTVFAVREPVAAGAAVTEAGPAPTAAAASVERDRRIRRAGAELVRARTVLTVGDEPAWLFYEDLGPNQAFEHPGRVAVVGVRSGKVRVSRELRWVPLVDGVLPAFFRTADAYESDRYRVFGRAWRTSAVARAAAATARAVAPDSPAMRRAADALAAERSCALRVSDTLGDFYDFGRVDKTRARLGRFLETLERLAPAFVSRRYTTKAGQTPVQAAQALVDGGCRDLLLYVAGGAARSGEPGVVVGVRSRSRSTLEWHVLTASDLRALLRANRSTTFKLVFDAPYAGRIADALRGEPNLLVLLTSGAADEPSFTYLPSVFTGSGGLLRNTSNPQQLLEFTNALLTGLERFAGDDAEVEHGLAEQAAGRSSSFMAWMLGRAAGLGVSPFAAHLLSPVQIVPPTSAPKPPQAPPVGRPAPVNHAPNPTTPASFVTREDTPRTITLTGNDPDGDPLSFAVTAQTTHGVLSGVAPDLTYTPARDFNGTDQLTYRVSDNRGGSAEETVRINVTPDNDSAAVIGGPSAGPTAYTEQLGTATVDNGLTVTDVDSTHLVRATATVHAGFADGDLLDADLTGLPAITKSYDAVTGVLTLTGTATLADYQAALRTVFFESTSDDPGPTRTIRFTGDDGNELGVPADRDIEITELNDAPVNSVPAAQSTHEDTALTFSPTTTPGANTISIADADARADDVQADLSVSHGTLAVGTTMPGLTVAGDGTASPTLTGSLAEINDALDGLAYTPAANFNGSDTLSISTDDLAHNGDGGAKSATDSVAITVDAVNDAPVNTLPAAGALDVNEDGSASVTNAFSISDVDASSDAMQVELEVLNGKLDVAAGGTLTGDDTATVKIEGSATQIKTSLGSVKYTPNADFAGGDTLTMTTSDLGHNPAPAATDTDTRAIAVSALNDPPVLTKPGSQTIDEDNPLTFTDGTSTELSVADVDAGSDDVRVVLTVGDGKLSDGGTPAATLTLTGSLTTVNAALDGLTYQPDANYNGTDTLSISVNDLGHNGAGAATGETDSGTVGITIDPVNDLPALSQPDGALTYTEDTPSENHAAPIAPSLAASDLDSTDGSSATVKITDGYVSAEDVLSYSGSFSSAVSAGGETLTLSGAHSIADYEAALRDVRYANTSEDPTTATRTVQFKLTDASGGASAGVTRTIDVTRTNDKPVVTTNTATTTDYTENDAPTVVDGSVAITDADSATLTGATVSISSGLHDPEDVLSATGGSGVTVAGYNGATGVLTLSGTASVAAYESVLKSVKYRNTSDNPFTNTRSVSFRVNDGAGANNLSDVASHDVTVAAVNDQPVVLTSGATPTFQESPTPTPVVVDSGVTIGDPDSAHLNRVTLAITTGHQSSDELAFTTNHGIQGSYDTSTGVLTLTPELPATTATVADFRDAAREVTFSTPSSAPGPSRTITFRARDTANAESDDVATARQSITISNVNTAPTIANVDGSVAYAENDPAVQLDDDVAVADADSPNLIGGTVRIAGDTFRSGDELSFTQHGNVDGSYDASTGALTITGTDTPAQYQAFLRDVKFRTVDDTPDLTPRTIEFVLTDGQPSDALSNVATKTVAPITATNDAPTATDQSFSTNEDTAKGFTVTGTDPENDTLTFHTFSDPPHGTISGSGATRTYTPDPNYNGPDSFTFIADDGNGGTDTGTVNVTVDAVNDAPVITTTGGDASFTEDAGSVAVDDALALADVENNTITGATVEITGGLQSGDDSLVYPSTLHGITGTVSGGGSKITFAGDGTPAQYDDVLTSVRFDNTSNTPSTAARTVTFTATDNGSPAKTGSATRGVTVTPVNDRPVVSVVDTTPLGYTEDDAATPVNAAGTASVSDVDSLAITGATVSFSGSYLPEDVLDATTTSGFSDSFDTTTGVLTITGMGTVAEYEALLETVTYRNTSNNPSSAQRTLEFVVNDGASSNNLSIAATRRVAVTAVNDAPVLSQPDATLTYTEDSPSENHALAVAPNLDVTDADDTSIAGATVQFTAGFAGAQDDLVFAGQNGITGAYNAGTGVLTLTGSTTPANYQTALRSVQYRNTSDAPSAALRTLSFQVSDGHTGHTPQSNTVTRDVTVVPTNDAPAAATAAFSGADSAIGNTTLIVNDPSDAAPSTAEPKKTIAGDLLAGATDPDGPSALTVVAGPVTTEDGGSVTLESDGDFTYHPKAATSCTDHDDAFTYTISDGTANTGTGTVNIHLNGCVWYVSNNAAGNAGTADAPFDTLAQAETASASGDTVYVFAGDTTSTGYDAGYAMKANQRLIGEQDALTIDPDGAGPLTNETLQGAHPGSRPKLTTTQPENVVALASGNEVRGVSIDPQGTGGGIAGGAGDAGGTIDDVTIADTGTLGTLPGLELNGTTGLFTVSNLTVNTTSATGVRLNNNGKVDFSSTQITTTGAKALDAALTDMNTSTFDAITVSGSGSGAVSMSNTSGTTVFGDGIGTDLSLTTTSGSTAAFGLSSAGTVTVGPGGTDNVSATGGPAIDVTGTSANLAFGTVSSTNSTGDGINLAGLGTGTFSAANTSTISGAAGIAFDLDGGSGTVAWPGSIANGSGASADITTRSGGTVTLSGAINDTNDTGGGISVKSNTGGTIDLTNATQVLDTGTLPGVDLDTNTGATVRFQGGALNVTTTSGRAFRATGGGTVEVTGSANQLASGTGGALLVQDTTIGANDLTFRSIASSGAPSGISVSNTTLSTGALNVTGTGVAPSGGTISGSSGPGIVLDTVPGGVSLDGVNVTNGSDDGIRATKVSDLSLADSTVTSNGSVVSAPSRYDRGLDWLNVTGAASISRTTISGSKETNAEIDNTTSGTLTLTVDTSTFKDNNTTTGNAGLRLSGDGTSVLDANIQHSTLSGNRDAAFSMRTETTSAATQTLLFQDNNVSGGNAGAVAGRPQISINSDGGTHARVTLNNNRIKSAAGSEVILNTLASSTSGATFDATVTNNAINDSQAGTLDAPTDGGAGIHGWAHGAGITRMRIADNSIANWGGRALELSHNDGSGANASADYTVTSNTLTSPDATANTFEGIYVFSGGAAGDSSNVCIDLTSNTFAGIGRQGSGDLATDRFATTQLRFPGFAAGAGTQAQLQSYIQGRNPGSPTATVTQYSQDATPAGAVSSCAQPLNTPVGTP